MFGQCGQAPETTKHMLQCPLIAHPCTLDDLQKFNENVSTNGRMRFNDTKEEWICLSCVLHVYLDHLKFCVVCINGRRYVCCSECNVVSNEYNEPTSCFVQPIGTHGGEVMYIWCVFFRGELGFLNCDDICMCVVNKQFELLEFVFDSVYVDLQYDELSLTFTAGSVSVVMWSSLVCR